jgi:hypothetical protein
MYHTKDSFVKEIAKIAFPEYTGQKFKVSVVTGPIDVSYNAYWSGGSRTWYNFVRLDTLKALGVTPAQSGFDAPIKGNLVMLVPSLVCVTHTHFCGNDMGITIHVHPENAPKLLPDTSVTRNEKIVLSATRSYKNTYAGRTGIRFEKAQKETGITLEQWEEASKTLIEKGMLNKARAITNDGRNIIQRTQLYELKENYDKEMDWWHEREVT